MKTSELRPDADAVLHALGMPPETFLALFRLL